jgi:predicted lipoprotein with Yx(FWY)xxD motif
MNAGSAGMVLAAGVNQRTVYTFSNDRPGVSNCSGACIAAWPALTVNAGQTPTAGPGVSGTLATITRADGSIQVTYNGLPLYFFHNDRSPGDTNGNYSGWHLVRP